MRLYNKSARSFIVGVADVKEGGKVVEDGNGGKLCAIEPEAEVNVTETCGARLVKAYPAALMRMDKPRARKVA